MDISKFKNPFELENNPHLQKILDKSHILDKSEVLDKSEILGQNVAPQGANQSKKGKKGGRANLQERALFLHIFCAFDDTNLYRTKEDQTQFVAQLQSWIRNFWGQQVYQGNNLNVSNVICTWVNSEVIPRDGEAFLWIGQGSSGSNKAIFPFNLTKASYIHTPLRNTGYIFEQTVTASTIIHEFGHLFGLADRYAEVYSVSKPSSPLLKDRFFRNPNNGNLPQRATVPLVLSKHREPDYDPFNNLYTDGNPLLTQEQLRIVLTNNQVEIKYPTVLIVVFPILGSGSLEGNVTNLPFAAVDVTASGAIPYNSNLQPITKTINFAWAMSPNITSGDNVKNLFKKHNSARKDWLNVLPKK